jgi:hypothetical protein
MRAALKVAALALMLPLVVAGQALAESAVVPNANANHNGTGNVNGPFGNSGESTGFTFQYEIGASQLSGIAVGSLISGIGFRLYSDSGTITQALDFPEFNVDVGKSTSSPANLSSNFAANEAAGTVLARSGDLSIAANTWIGNQRLNPFLTISFTTPYIYTGGDLLITISDLLNASNGNAFVPLDAVLPSNKYGNVGNTDYNDTTGFANFFYEPVMQLDFSAPVPEPASWAVMIAGLGLVGALRQRRAHKKTAA